MGKDGGGAGCLYPPAAATDKPLCVKDSAEVNWDPISGGKLRECDASRSVRAWRVAFEATGGKLGAIGKDLPQVLMSVKRAVDS